ncbi:integrase arm-type DNA-binding domain-containing protein [Neisseria sp. 74A18]|uniref:tyrosine-type recombinase/integrase n=1 Tax=Neisseria sp. 74A18 TaxID=1696094 RepID=UPI0006CAE252|nr:integrase arm-type DNA-binding domain-containing protein [Neisseria sp. 74A18]KPN72893.1 integrase [Neisseria sp. 74A18]
MPLNDLQIKRIKPSDKKQTLSDGGGLALVVNAISRGGTKYFVYNYRFDGKQQSLRIGKYPDIGLAEAREQHQQARNNLAKGINPSQAKQQAKQERQAALLNTFAAVTKQWHTKNLPRWKEKHAARIMQYFESDVFPHIGNRPIKELRVSDIKAVIERISERGALETAEKIRQWIGSVFNHAALLELTDGNPAAPLVGYLPKKEAAHMPALPREELTEFYRRLILADTHQQNRICVMLIMLCFARNTEIRGGKWQEIDFDKKTWVIPAERMKRPRPHVIPLADWPLELLKELHTITGHSPFLFPSRTAIGGHISKNTAGKIINNMGYKGIATPHGFRSLASSVLNEQGYNPDAIERQLAHIDDNKIRAAYNRTDYMAERVEMMQWYSDYLRARYNEARGLIQGG